MTGETAHDGASGDDTLTGGAGADHFVFDPNHGNDVVTDFTDGEDLIDLSAFSTISGFSDLTVTSDENGVTIDLTAHGGGTILLQGFALNDLDASDFLFRVNQDIDGDDNDNTLTGGTGDDTITGGLGNDSIEGGEGNDTLYGQDDNDSLDGGAGNDNLYGHDGDDTLEGGSGDDYMRGGGDADTFVFAAGHGNDTIRDFADGEDLIDLTQVSGISGFDDLSITVDGTTAVIDLTAHGGGTIRLDNISVDDLDADDFLFQEPPQEPTVEGI